MKRVLFVSHSSTLTGAPTVLFNIACAIDRHQFEPLVLFPERGPLIEKFERANIPVAVIEIGDSRWGRFHIPMIEAFCAVNKIDIVHANTVHSFPFVMAAKKMGIPCFWYIHEMLGSELRFNVSDEDFRDAVKNATRISAASNACRMQFLEYCQSREIEPPDVVVAHYGFQIPEQVVPEEMKSPAELLAIGNLAPHKGYDYLIDALGTLNAHGDRAQLTILGDGDLRYLEKLWKKAEELRVEDNLHFVTAQMDTSNWIKRADIVVIPSIVENFSLSISEAMTLGKPVVATDVGAIREFFVDGETGLIVPSKNSAKLANAISRFIENPAFARECGKKARRQIAENFSLSYRVGLVEEQYLSMNAPARKNAKACPLLVEGLIAANEKLAAMENEAAGRYAFLGERIENLERDVRTLEGVVNNLLQKFPLRWYRKISGLLK